MSQIIKESLLKAQGNSEVQDWINTTLTAHLRKAEEGKEATYPQVAIEHMVDFLLSDKAPKRLRKMSIQQAHIAAEKWTKTLIKKAQNIVETDEDVKVVLRCRETGMRLVRLIGKPAFEREGKLMNHCVSSYHGRDGVEIYSLRDSKNEPHCTIELQKRDGNIQQVKGKGNGPIHPKYISYVLKSLEKLGVSVRDSEMRNLGYAAPSEEYWKFLDSHLPNTYKEITFKGKRFLYVG